MAPEQVIVGDLTARLTCLHSELSYEMACLRRLLEEESPRNQWAVLDHKPIPLSEALSDFPKSLSLVIEKALEKKPD